MTEGTQWETIVDDVHTTRNFKIILELIEQYPKIKEILKIFELEEFSFRYAIHKIWRDNDRFVFYFYQSLQTNFNEETITLLISNKVTLQVPGNQEYNFSISLKI